ncbi:MAG: hypothetical protein DBY23_03895 [Bacillota bacterium]|jgi:hypothetical protein|nr:MAG: hypothetical protein DBY23_03895 [Bacillota bacterium]
MKPKFLTAAICIVALFSVDLTYGYHPISPYAYCAGNPIKYVDPDGQDVWEINQNGEIVNRIKDKTQDAFFMVNNEGKRMEGDMYSVSFEYGTVKGVSEVSYEIDGENYNLTLFNIAGDDNGQKLFEVMSNNQNDIEWSHTKVGTADSGNGFVSTSHTPYKEASSLYIINNGYTIREHTHSHPSTPVPSDNDRVFHTALNNGRKVPTYIYHNNGVRQPNYLQYTGSGAIYPYSIQMNNGFPSIRYNNRQPMTPWRRR